MRPHPPGVMDLVPTSLAALARAWDEQSLELTAAARDLGSDSSGFTPQVAAAAARFSTAWERHARGLAAACDRQAEGLRATIEDVVGIDEATLAEISGLLARLDQRR